MFIESVLSVPSQFTVGDIHERVLRTLTVCPILVLGALEHIFAPFKVFF